MPEVVLGASTPRFWLMLDQTALGGDLGLVMPNCLATAQNAAERQDRRDDRLPSVPALHGRRVRKPDGGRAARQPLRIGQRSASPRIST
jgi:hypothetical protein